LKFIKVINNFIPQSMCSELIDIIDFSIDNNIALNRDSSTVKDNQIEIRKSINNDFFPINGSEISARILQMLNFEFHKYLDELRSEDCLPFASPRAFNLFGQKSSFETKDGYYAWHCETTSLETTHRALSWILYLNDVPEGEGETEFIHQQVKINPKTATLVIFPSSFTHSHRGNPVETINKYILTGWAYHVPNYTIE
jgi:hypothetical protein